jgi:release factor glutamine methyltransferase
MCGVGFVAPAFQRGRAAPDLGNRKPLAEVLDLCPDVACDLSNLSLYVMPSTAQIREALKEGIARLNSASIPSAALAGELLLMHALSRDRTWLYTHPEEPIDPSAAEKYFALIARRIAGEPTQYLAGKQEFWGLEFEVTPAVLIPRPETEHIIEVALDRIGDKKRTERLRIADVGTGSGCIAVALAKEFPNAQIIATDISPQALKVAKRNASRHEVANRIQFIETDLLAELFHHSPLTTHHSQLFHESRVTSHESRPFALIASNPPYIARSDAHTLAQEIREHEPEIALFGGETGSEIYARLIEQAEALLAPSGQLIVELGFGAAQSVRQMIEARNVWTNLAITNDLAGIPRVIAAELTI